MYGKIFESIYDGTLAEDWRALITFQQFIILCDSDGVIDMTPSAISRRTGIPIEHIKAGIEILEKEDKHSRSGAENGKRIVRLDDHRPWGWKIVNHSVYRDKTDYNQVLEQNRERQRRFRDSQRNVTVTERNVTVTLPSRHTDTDTDTDTEEREADKPPRSNGRFIKPSIPEIREYCEQIESSINPSTFFSHYESVGWKVGKNPMKDWKSAVRGWTSRDNK